MCGCAVIFQLYDTDGDGYVTSQDVLSLLRKTAAKALSENQLQLVRSPHEPNWHRMTQWHAAVIAIGCVRDMCPPCNSMSTMQKCCNRA